MKEIVSANKRDIARELARRYSTMTHDELDILESILVSQKYAKGEMILKEGEICRQFLYIDKGLVRQFYFKHGDISTVTPAMSSGERRDIWQPSLSPFAI